jgi:hypothetical protein
MTSEAARKADTLRKIQLGGLVIKSGLATACEDEAAVLLGALIDAVERLNDPIAGEQERARFRALGDRAFAQAAPRRR